MTEDQKIFWQTVVMHFVIAVFGAYNALPYVENAPFSLTLLATSLGAAGGLFMGSRAWVLHATHRPSLPRGLAEGLVILLLVYAVIRPFESAPEVWELLVGCVLWAIPAWFAAYAAFMLVETVGTPRQPTRF